MPMKSSSFALILRKNQTSAESLLWSRIRNRQLSKVKFRRQYLIPPFIVDFVSIEHRLIIEVDGGGHNKARSKIYDDARKRF